MADIVNELANELAMPVEEVRIRLGMDKEEVTRLLERGSMVTRASADGFSEAWRSAPK